MANEELLINAEPIKKFIVDGLNNPNPLKAFGNDAIQILAEIEYAPTVDAVEVVHGRWIPLEYDGFADGNPVWDLWECSECREEHSGDEDTLTPYCPNCGTKMDGGAGSDLTGSN